MPNPDAIVDLVEGVSAPIHFDFFDTPTSRVAFKDSDAAYLNPRAPDHDLQRAMLQTLARIGRPAFVELADPQHRVVSRVLIPIVGRVLGVEREQTGDVRVRLDACSGRHLVRASLPEFRTVLDLLKRSRDTGVGLRITDDPETHDIFDVRLSADDHAFVQPVGPVPCGSSSVTQVSTVPVATADRLFFDMLGSSCHLPNPAADCIPFLYPDSGCWARAHRMCQLIAAQGFTPGKIWIYGTRLSIRTPNRFHCRQDWDWHVAPVLRGPSSGTPHWRVIDPSVFTSGSVSSGEWKDALGDKKARMVLTGAEVFWQSESCDGRGENQNIHDGVDETDEALAVYREELKRRAAHRAEPPPYARCQV